MSDAEIGEPAYQYPAAQLLLRFLDEAGFSKDAPMVVKLQQRLEENAAAAGEAHNFFWLMTRRLNAGMS